MLDIPAGPSRAAVAALWLLTIALAVQTTLGAWQIGVPVTACRMWMQQVTACTV